MTFPWRCLSEPLAPSTHEKLQRYLKQLLKWQANLTQWPAAPSDLPKATPIVSVYSGGTLRGCFGSVESVGDNAVARALLRALHDMRFAAIAPNERDDLTLNLSFLCAPRLLTLAEIRSEMEPGRHGLALVPERGTPSMIHSSVAEEHGLDCEGMIAALAHKAGRVANSPWLKTDEIYLLTFNDLVVRGKEPSQEFTTDASAISAGSRWLKSLIHSDGKVSFAAHPRNNSTEETGILHHGRVAIALTALQRIESSSPLLQRALARLTWDIERSLGGNPVNAWPTTPELVASTLALAHMAGAPVQGALKSIANHDSLRTELWSAAQVVTALGTESPQHLVDAVLTDPNSTAWSPWSVRACVAADRNGELTPLVDALLDHVRDQAPYPGGVGKPIAEIAQTAATIEALLDVPPSDAITATIAKSRQFLERWQLRTNRVAWLPPEHDGAFPVSPTRSYSQVDSAGHALLALCGPQ